MTVLLTAEKLALIRGERLLLKDLSLTLNSGQAIHVTGANGSGKTSLFKVLTGLLRPNAGVVTKPNQSQIVYLGHQTTVKPTLTVEENLRLNAAIFDGISISAAQLKAALTAVRLADVGAMPCAKLSAGQQRRVMLARLWLCRDSASVGGRIWLLDEPLTALDSCTVAAVETCIDEYLARGSGVIFASHQPLNVAHGATTLALGAL